MKIHPQLSDHYHLPMIYENVYILTGGAVINNSSPVNDSFSVSINPNSTDPKNQKRAKDIQAILKKTYTETKDFINVALGDKIDDEVKEKLILDLKTLVENYRSILDYIAHYIAQKCQPIPDSRKVQFPIAKTNVTEAVFKSQLTGAFPNLEINCKPVFDYLLSIQHFNNEIVLSELNELANGNKHRELATLEYVEHESLLLSCGEVGIRLGELGVSKIEIGENGMLVLNNRNKQSTIKGPVTLTVNNYSSITSVPNIEIKAERLNLLSQTGHSKSIAGQVWSISSNIFRIVNRICNDLK